MIIHTNSFRYLWEVLENSEYGDLFKDLVVVDAGCNVGSFSLWIYPYAKEIYAIDMDQERIDDLNKTAHDNVLTKIRTFCTRLLDLGSFLSQHGIPIVDVLKIDIEGDEWKVFLDKFPADRVRWIVGEYHPEGTRTGEYLQNTLQNMSYRYTELPNNHFVARR